jgi:hypothetical protein
MQTMPSVDTSILAKVRRTSNDAKEKAITIFGELKTSANATQWKALALGRLATVKKTANNSKEKAIILFGDFKTSANENQLKAVALVRDPQFQTCTIATVGGAITFGSVGGTFGLASGIAVGSTAGMVPALFTLGLSIPAGGVLGGLAGICGGTLLGGVSGGAGGCMIYKYRIQIKDGFMSIKVKANGTFDKTKQRINTQVCKLRASVSQAAKIVQQQSMMAVDVVKAKSSEAVTFATTTRPGVTSSAAVGGAVLGGATTGAFGTVAGAAVGIVPAFFTFGLSIPVGAMAGLCVGTAVGGGAGAVGGGLVGYGGFTHRKAISDGVQSSWINVSTTAKSLKAKTFTCAADAKESMKSIVRGSTGGSDQGKMD